MSKFIPFYLAGASSPSVGAPCLSTAPGMGGISPSSSWSMAGLATPRWADLVAITNNRLFDLAALACMGGILASCFFRADGQERRRLVAMGVVMLLGPW